MNLHIPTTLSDQGIAQFQHLCKEHYGVHLNRQEAQEEAQKLLSFLAVIIRHHSSKHN